MALLTGRYDPNAQAQQDFSPLPSGEYLARITDSDMKPTKNNDGEYLELVYEVMDEAYKGRKVWARLNLDNPNAKTVEIAQRQFASVREATGVMNPRDSADLHHKPHIIRVEFIPAGTTQKNGYTTQKDSNEVKAWRKADGQAGGMGNAPSSASPQPSAAATPASPSSAPAANAAPWRRTA